MSQYLHELCSSIIEDFFGEFHARIFHQLSHQSRYNAHQIAQKTHLPIRQVKSGLAVLVQQRLVYYHSTQDGLCTYQANTTSAYNVLRSGRLADHARNRHGDLAANVVQDAVSLGFTTVAELANRTLLNANSPMQKLANGQSQHSEAANLSREQIITIIQTLRDHGYLLNVRSAQFQSDFDAQQIVEGRMRSQGLVPAVKGRKGQLELEERIMGEVRERQSTHYAEHGFFATDLKRSSEDANDPLAKRPRLNGSGNGHMKASDDKTLVAVSYHNIVTDIRDQYLQQLARKSVGEKQSRALSCALLQLPASRQWYVPPESQVLDVGAIRKSMNKTNGQSNGHHRSNGHAVTNGYDHLDDDDDHVTFADVDRHLLVLNHGSFTFLQPFDGGDQWRINKHDLDRFVQRKEMFRLMGDRLPPPALRIIRMLVEKGKMDEKSLQEKGLLGAKELRQSLAWLKQRGFVDLQEIPREAQRQPNRTIFLWFHDPERVRKVLLENLYKAMTRLMERLKLERQKLSSTLEKVQRSDVQGSEDIMLSAPELQVLRRWQRLEQWLFAELCRLDESVMILRDV